MTLSRNVLSSLNVSTCEPIDLIKYFNTDFDTLIMASLIPFWCWELGIIVTHWIPFLAPNLCNKDRSQPALQSYISLAAPMRFIPGSDIIVRITPCLAIARLNTCRSSSMEYPHATSRYTARDTAQVSSTPQTFLVQCGPLRTTSSLINRGPHRSQPTTLKAGWMVVLKSGRSPMICLTLSLRDSLHIVQCLSMLDAILRHLRTQ